VPQFPTPNDRPGAGRCRVLSRSPARPSRGHVGFRGVTLAVFSSSRPVHLLTPFHCAGGMPSRRAPRGSLAMAVSTTPGCAALTFQPPAIAGSLVPGLPGAGTRRLIRARNRLELPAGPAIPGGLKESRAPRQSRRPGECRPGRRDPGRQPAVRPGPGRSRRPLPDRPRPQRGLPSSARPEMAGCAGAGGSVRSSCPAPGSPRGQRLRSRS